MKYSSTLPLSFPRLIALLFFVAITSFWPAESIRAQNCTYTIQMFDSFGDGWNGGTLTVISNGVTTTHTLLFDFTGTSTFQVTNGAPVVISWQAGSFAFEPSFELLNPDGLVLFSSGVPIPAGQVYSATGLCPNCPAPNPNLTVINQITDTSAYVNWFTVGPADSYFVEYGPQGFPLGSGLVLETTSSNADLTGLNPCVDYDVYIASYCGVDSVSIYVGPFTFQTTYTPSAPSGDTCTYTFQLYDSFGDGWNGSDLSVTHNGSTAVFTILDGEEETFQFVANSNLPIDFSYSPGFYEAEVSYEIIDPNGFVIFSDGPNPQQGDVFTTIACPSCPGPIDAWMSDVNANNARLSWTSSPDAVGDYIIEYGPMGFTLGTGTVLNVVGSQSTATLTGLLENSWYNVYIKLDCGTEFSKPVGPIMFHTLWMNDIGVTGIATPDPATQCNLNQNETVTVLLTNFGQVPQTLFEFYFAVNGQAAPIPVPQDGLFTGVIGNDSTQVIQFETTWDFSEPGIYIIEAWTVLEGDSDPANDTFRIQIQTAFPKPIKENFEDNAVMAGWTHDGTVAPPFAHNNQTFVLADNLYSGDQNFTLTTNRVGPVYAGDSLYFDYRYVNWSAGTTATVLSTDTLQVQISSDCEETWETVLTINSSNHVTSTDMATKVILLDPWDGEAINVRWVAKWGAGDYWFDLDNINMTGCPGNLALLGTVKGSVEGASTGSITVDPSFGTGPFSYTWNTGDTTATVDSLPSGVYEVTVTDANGCSDTKIFEVGIFVSADEASGVEQISLYPNPASDRAYLDINLTAPMDVEVRMLNLNGQVIFESEQKHLKNIRQEIDLGLQPSGMYILQIVADGKPHYAKLMVTK